jgi:hypothetical protein
MDMSDDDVRVAADHLRAQVFTDEDKKEEDEDEESKEDDSSSDDDESSLVSDTADNSSEVHASYDLKGQPSEQYTLMMITCPHAQSLTIFTCSLSLLYRFLLLLLNN